MRRIYLVSSGDEVRYCIYAIKSLGGNNMNNLKNIFKTKKNKTIGIITVVIIIAGVSLGIYFATKKDMPVIVFNENIVVEYGQKSFSNDEETNQTIDEDDKVEKLPILMPEDIIQKDKSNFDEVSFNKIASSKEPMTLEFRFIDTSEVGKHEGTLYARLVDEVKEFKFEYEVKDTHSPIIDGEDEVTLEHDESFDVTQYSAYDIVDGELPITVLEGSGNIEDDKTVMKLSATDKNNNETIKEVRVTILEKEIAVSEDSSTTLPNTGSNSGTPTDKDTNPNTGSNNSGNSGSGTKPVAPTKPVEPTKPVKPVEPTKPTEPNKGNGDWLEYKDYGSYEGCNAVLDEVSRSKVREWKQSMCDKDGTLVYKKR